MAVNQRYVEVVAVSSFSLHIRSAVMGSWMHVAELGGNHRAAAWRICGVLLVGEG
jgi:hypothetical protein